MTHNADPTCLPPSDIKFIAYAKQLKIQIKDKKDDEEIKYGLIERYFLDGFRSKQVIGI